MNPNFEKLKPYLDKSMAIHTALALLSWDTETLAPAEAAEQTAKMMGILAGEAYDKIINEEVKDLVYKLKNEKEGLSEIEKGIVKVLLKDFERLEKIPAKDFVKFNELISIASVKWAEAKRSNDFSKFAPVLAEEIKYLKDFARRRAKEGESLYDIILKDYEEDFDTEKLDIFFGKIKENVIPLIKKITKYPKEEPKFLFRHYDIEKQKEFVRFIAEYLGYDFSRGVLAESEHPFTGGLHNKDVRITTHYYENNLESSIFSVIHEVGHGLYEMNIPDEMTQTLVGEGSSMGLHESQSRFLENLIGRNKAFWEPIYPKLQEKFEDALKEIDLDTFMKAINRTYPSLIRTEADELTYSLHILIRYEIEKKIFNEDYPVEKLPALWNALYLEYLGVESKEDSEGILQDIHWSQGSFGYFPSYAIGSAVSSQLLHQMKKDMDFDGLLRQGNLSPILNWLKEKVHKYGKLKNTNEILLLATGEAFNADYYIDYLTTKFQKD